MGPAHTYITDHDHTYSQQARPGHPLLSTEVKITLKKTEVKFNAHTIKKINAH